MDKKAAIGLATILFIIIALVGFGVTSNIGLKAARSTGSISEGAICKASLGIQTGTEDISMRFGESKNICETIQSEIDISYNDKYELMSFMGEKLARSYWIIYEGSDNINQDLWKRDGFWSSGYKCAIMYNIDLKEKTTLLRKKANDDFSISREEFVNFLKTEIYPPKKKDGLTYHDYFFEKQNVVFDVLPHQNEEGFGFFSFSYLTESSASDIKKTFMTDYLLDTDEIYFDTVDENNPMNWNIIVGLLALLGLDEVEISLEDLDMGEPEEFKLDTSYAISICSYEQSTETGHETNIQTMIFLTESNYAKEVMEAYII